MIVNGDKDIESRTWSTDFRGRVYVHAGRKIKSGIMPPEELRERIRVLFKLKQTPTEKHVKFLLSRLEKYKRTGYV